EIRSRFPKPGLEEWTALIYLRAVPPKGLKTLLEWVLTQPSLSERRRFLVDALARTLEGKAYAKLTHRITLSTPIDSLEGARQAFLQTGLDLEASQSFGGRINAGVSIDGETLLTQRFLSSNCFVLHRDQVEILPWEDCLRGWLKKIERP